MRWLAQTNTQVGSRAGTRAQDALSSYHPGLLPHPQRAGAGAGRGGAISSTAEKASEEEMGKEGVTGPSGTVRAPRSGTIPTEMTVSHPGMSSSTPTCPKRDYS